MTDPVRPDPVRPAPGTYHVAGFVCGLVALVLFNVPIVAVPAGVIGAVISARALGRMPRNTRGRGLAIAGLILSGLAAVASTALLLSFVLNGAAA